MRRQVPGLLVFALLFGACGGGGRGAAIPDVRTALIIVAQDPASGVNHVYAAPQDGGPQLDLTPAGMPGGVIDGDGDWSPDHTKFVFLVGDGLTGESDLYVVAPGVSAPVRVSTARLPGQAVGAFAWCPDSQRIAYALDSLTGDASRLQRAAADGSLDVDVSGGIVAQAQGLRAFAWSPDGTRLAMAGAFESTSTNAVYVVDAATGARTRVSGPDGAGGGSAGELAWSPDGTRVSFRGNFDSGPLYELYVALATGVGGRTRLHAPLTAGQLVHRSAWAPNGAYVAFLGTLLSADLELYVAPAAGGSATRRSQPLVPGGEVRRFTWAPDSSRIAYVAYATTLTEQELFSATPDGSGPVGVVSGTPVPGGDIGAFRWSPDSQWIAYTGDVAVNGREDVHVASPTGAQRAIVSVAVVNDQAGDLAWDPSSQRIAYAASHRFVGGPEAWVATRAAGSAVPVYGAATPPDEGVGIEGWNEAGTRLVFSGYDAATDTSFVASHVPGSATIESVGDLFSNTPSIERVYLRAGN